MDTGNLQLQGVCLALASLNKLLVSKGLVSPEEIQAALSQAEVAAESDERFFDSLTPPQRDAVTFPIRFLQAAMGNDGADLSFTALAKAVGKTKKPYNDQF
ncbi:hypothetical protein [Phyllobacterium sp. SB3]|uniref:hypothetical protein n=1 Tax=Phyllobacterium sp. SB3 TaxID=3156073 RepID=UPI0032AEFDAD